MNYQEKFALIENMRRYGGNFVSKLADALCAADPQNTERIANAFPEIVEKYLKTE
jgi:ABC-type Zn uptake system ZnuABC Zn-binding protein ZnuA